MEEVRETVEFAYDQLGRHLKCTDCHNLLSVPPIVVLKDTGEYKCGRCSITGEDTTGIKRDEYPGRIYPKRPVYKTAVRDLPYEELAKDVSFPCKNRKYGCGNYYECEQPVLYHWGLHYGHDYFCPVWGCFFFIRGAGDSILDCPRNCGGFDNNVEVSSYIKHVKSTHKEKICQRTGHSHIVIIPKDSEGKNYRVFFSSDDKILFVLRVDKSGLEFKFSLRSVGTTNRLFQFEIKSGHQSRNKSRKGEILLSTPESVYEGQETTVKVVLQKEEEEYEFKLDFVGKVKSKDIVKVPVKNSDVLKCAKCHKYLSVKPVMATKSGFECGYCFKTTEGGKVRLKAYEVLAEMVLFPCEEPGCDKSFGISEMRKHRDSHKLSKPEK